MSEPLPPIKVTLDGDEFSPALDFVVIKTEGHAIPVDGSFAGRHVTCGGMVYLRPTTALHQALVCGGCFLRVVVPRSVKTFTDLRTHAPHLLVAEATRRVMGVGF